MPERLTRWENNDKDVADLIEGKSDFDGLTEAINRLAEYEDSGLSPEEVQEFAKARNLIGKTVYCVFAGVKKVMKRKIHGFEVSSDRIVLLAENGKKDYYLAEISAVGKTIFLTREEAEKALEVRE